MSCGLVPMAVALGNDAINEGGRNRDDEDGDFGLAANSATLLLVAVF